MENLLTIRDLSVEYDVSGGRLSAVSHVDMQIQRGEIYAVVGESGCGKSTIASTIMRLTEDNTSVTGEILYQGKNLLELSPRKMEEIRGGEIGIIFQNPLDSLNPVYRSGTQVYEAIRLDQIPKGEAWQQVKGLYGAVRIPEPEDKIRRFPYELSGGMRQRVMIAMMLSRHPKLLIADEPTTALDVTIEAQILKILRELRDNPPQVSILLITHNFGVVSEIADRMGVMYAGKLVEEGEVQEVMKNPAHPYTKALLESLPRQSKRMGRIRSIEGNVPRILGEYSGCRFCNRCPLATEICAEMEPPRKEIKPGHLIFCHKEVNS